MAWIDRSFDAEGELIGYSTDETAPDDSVIGADKAAAAEILRAAFQVLRLETPFFENPESRCAIRAYVLHKRLASDIGPPGALPDAWAPLFSSRFPWEETPRGLLSASLLLYESRSLARRDIRLRLGALKLRMASLGEDHPRTVAALYNLAASFAGYSIGHEREAVAEESERISRLLGEAILEKVNVLAASFVTTETVPATTELRERLLQDPFAMREVAVSLVGLGRSGRWTSPASPVATLEQALALAEPGDSVGLSYIWYHLGNAHLAADNAGKSEASFRRAIELREPEGLESGSLRECWLGLALALGEQGKTEELLTLSDRIASLPFDSEHEIRCEDYLPLIRTHLQREQHEPADRLVDRALSVWSDNVNAISFLAELGQVHLDRGDHGAAELACNRALQEIEAARERAAKEGREPYSLIPESLVKTMSALSSIYGGQGRDDDARNARDKAAKAQREIDDEKEKWRRARAD